MYGRGMCGAQAYCGDMPRGAGYIMGVAHRYSMYQMQSCQGLAFKSAI